MRMKKLIVITLCVFSYAACAIDLSPEPTPQTPLGNPEPYVFDPPKPVKPLRPFGS